jgi:hypothetical protein
MYAGSLTYFLPKLLRQYYPGKSSAKTCATSAFKNRPKKKIAQNVGEKSPNLVTLIRGDHSL